MQQELVLVSVTQIILLQKEQYFLYAGVRASRPQQMPIEVFNVWLDRFAASPIMQMIFVDPDQFHKLIKVKTDHNWANPTVLEGYFNTQCFIPFHQQLSVEDNKTYIPLAMKKLAATLGGDEQLLQMFKADHQKNDTQIAQIIVKNALALANPSVNHTYLQSYNKLEKELTRQI
jgi:hypothetical protein